ncbi:SDR family NAD(P)-dependent oxidoreductase [Nocardia suismassiliense]|uniref:SDR family NAD(P)-dependent oxidoreductase n=1 Tax=Nocardia suismassiliense TaxID=2077092 RepID=A0ABW6R0C7_9NOCA
MQKTAVVTGGGYGIGRAIAEHLLAQDMNVVITGRRAEILDRTAAELGPRVRALGFDASDPDAVQHAVTLLPERIDVLVNNAGGATEYDFAMPPRDQLKELREAWLRNIEANLMTTVLMTAALEHRIPAGGRIIVIGSIGARGFKASTYGYGPAKAALEPWAGDLARELGSRKITVNVVCPGFTLSNDRAREFLDSGAAAPMIDASATGRVTEVADVAGTVAYLATPAASQITGQVIHVNGGIYP